MAQFPSLKTGVVAQYPSTKEYRFSTETRRFVDGSEQRYRNFRGSRQRWVVNLSQLDESEIAELADFFRMGYLVDSSSHYILGVGVPALVASTIVL